PLFRCQLLQMIAGEYSIAKALIVAGIDRLELQTLVPRGVLKCPLLSGPMTADQLQLRNGQPPQKLIATVVELTTNRRVTVFRQIQRHPREFGFRIGLQLAFKLVDFPWAKFLLADKRVVVLFGLSVGKLLNGHSEQRVFVGYAFCYQERIIALNVAY